MPSTPSTFMLSTIEEGIKDRRAALFGRLVDDVHSAQLQRDRVVAVDIAAFAVDETHASTRSLSAIVLFAIRAEL
jgi:hypothetical protein